MLSASIELPAFELACDRAVEGTFRVLTPELLRGEAERLRREVEVQFATEGRHGGEPWPARAADLRHDKRRPATGRPRRPLLISTGTLRASLIEEFNPAHVERLDVDDRGIPCLVFGSRVPYAGFHQRGTRWIPPRVILTEKMLGGSRASFP